jgi:hypothetical protein
MNRKGVRKPPSTVQDAITSPRITRALKATRKENAEKAAKTPGSYKKMKLAADSQEKQLNKFFNLKFTGSKTTDNNRLRKTLYTAYNQPKYTNMSLDNRQKAVLNSLTKDDKYQFLVKFPDLYDVYLKHDEELDLDGGDTPISVNDSGLSHILPPELPDSLAERLGIDTQNVQPVNVDGSPIKILDSPCPVTPDRSPRVSNSGSPSDGPDDSGSGSKPSQMGGGYESGQNPDTPDFSYVNDESNNDVGDGLNDNNQAPACGPAVPPPPVPQSGVVNVDAVGGAGAAVDGDIDDVADPDVVAPVPGGGPVVPPAGAGAVAPAAPSGGMAPVASASGQVNPQQRGQFGDNIYKTTSSTPPFEEDVKTNDITGLGDKYSTVQTENNAEGTMRPKFGMAAAANAIPSATDQILSDLRFDMFDTVAPGFGNGSDNKIFLMETNRDAKIIYADPLSTPGSDIGPEAGVGVSSWKLQRQIPTEKVAQYHQGLKAQVKLLEDLVRAPSRRETTNVLGDDVGFDRSLSSKGLKRNRSSIFAPIISNEMEFRRVKIPCGAELNGYQFRRVTDSLRYPSHLESRTEGMGGPTLNKRRSLDIILH